MKTYCKRADPTDPQTIERYAYEAMAGKLQRKDYSDFVADYCSLSAKEIRKRARRTFRRAWSGDHTRLTMYRVGAYFGYFKAARVRHLRPARRTDPACINIYSTLQIAGTILGALLRRDLRCAA